MPLLVPPLLWFLSVICAALWVVLKLEVGLTSETPVWAEWRLPNLASTRPSPISKSSQTTPLGLNQHLDFFFFLLEGKRRWKKDRDPHPFRSDRQHVVTECWRGVLPLAQSRSTRKDHARPWTSRSLQSSGLLCSFFGLTFQWLNWHLQGGISIMGSGR